MQVLALESITLPTRLRPNQPGRSSFADIEAVLSNDGNRKIAALGFSLEDPDVHDTAANGKDPRDGSSNGYANGSAQDTDETDIPELDVDMQPTVPDLAGSRGTTRPRSHVFSQLQSLRGTWKSSLEIEDENSASRDRFSQGPRTQRFVSIPGTISPSPCPYVS